MLVALDGDVLRAHGCLFGGGTAIALRFGEYRESIDIDFIVSRLDGYRSLRQSVGGAAGLQAIMRAGRHLELAREVRADQYGIRTLVQVPAVEGSALPIKLEIVYEARITVDSPGDPADPATTLCGISTLSPLDMASTKLLANTDRWPDDAVFSRDLIDLAMMSPPPALLRQAITKASVAYGEAVGRDVLAAVQNLRERPARLAICMQALGMTATPKALLWERLRKLAKVVTAM